MASRRQFLTGVAAAVAATALPIPAMAAVAEAVAPEAPKLLAFAYGSEEAFNWQPIFAHSLEDATRMIRAAEGLEADEDCHYLVERVARWDKRGDAESVTPADWIRAGMGHVCDRCGEELHDGGDPYPIITGEVVVCNSCLTLAERCLHDADCLTDELADDIGCDGEDVVRERLQSEAAWEAAQAIWPNAVRQAQS